MKSPKRMLALIILALLAAGLGCNLPALSTSTPEDSTPQPASLPTQTAALSPTSADETEPPSGTSPAMPPSQQGEGLITPEDLEYLGAFRLPEANGGSSWEYSGQGLTYYPDGDLGGEADGFPGSLFGIGSDIEMLVSEISIPAPVNSRNLEDLNTAVTLQPFQDLTGGLLDPQAIDLPVADLEYLPPQEGQSYGKLHFVFGQHFQEFEPSHGWAELDLTNPDPAGAWVLDGYTNYATNDYLFAIPEDWSAAYAPGLRLASGRFREGVWSGGGPALFAYAPWLEGTPPAPGATLQHVVPLLLYGVQEPGGVEITFDESMQMQGYQLADHWFGGAWLTAGERSAVVFVGTKALGRSWYGFANGVEWAYDCAEQEPPTCPEVPEWPYDNRGYWAENYQAQIVFFNPADLGRVARGEMETWQPQPYATLALDEFLFDPQLHHENYKRDLVGAAAFDRQHGLLYIIERLADEAKSVVHVWRVR